MILVLARLVSIEKRVVCLIRPVLLFWVTLKMNISLVRSSFNFQVHEIGESRQKFVIIRT